MLTYVVVLTALTLVSRVERDLRVYGAVAFIVALYIVVMLVNEQVFLPHSLSVVLQWIIPVVGALFVFGLDQLARKFCARRPEGSFDEEGVLDMDHTHHRLTIPGSHAGSPVKSRDLPAHDNGSIELMSRAEGRSPSVVAEHHELEINLSKEAGLGETTAPFAHHDIFNLSSTPSNLHLQDILTSDSEASSDDDGPFSLGLTPKRSFERARFMPTQRNNDGP